MKNLFKHQSVLFLFACIALFATGMNNAQAQCNSSSQDGSQTSVNTGGLLSWSQSTGDYEKISSVANGASYTVSSSTGSDYITIKTSNAGSGGTVITSGTSPVTFTATSSTIYVITTRNSSCGTTFGSRTISWYESPYISSAPANGCVGSTITLTGTGFIGATGVSFNGTDATSYTVVSATSITAVVPSGATTGLITVTGPGGSDVTTTFTVKASPSDNSGANQSACTGTSISLGASSTSGHTYKWSPTTGLSSSTVANPTIANPTTTTTYTLTETITSSGCSAANTTVVTVNAAPANKTVAAAVSSLCSGSSTNITVASSVSGVSYQLRNDADNSNIGSAVAGNGGTISLPTGTLNSTTTFNVLATVASSGCSLEMSTTKTVTVNATPSDNSGSNQNACAGVSTSIGASSTSGHTYKWSPTTGLSSSTAANPTIANPTTSTTYTLTETITSTGCSTSNSTVVTVNALPANKIVTVVTSSFCGGSSTNVQVASSVSGVNYQLRNDADNSTVGSAVAGNGGTISLPTGTLTSTTTFNVLATVAATGCSLEMTTTPTVTVNAVPSDNSGANQAICNGATATLGAASVTGHTYSWSPSTGLSNATAANPTCSLTVTTTYTLTERITSSGCTASNSTVVTVNTIPGDNSGGDQTVCGGSSITLGASSTSGHTYKWSPSTGLSSSVAANPTATPTVTTTYTLTETITSSGCSVSNTSVITYNVLPTSLSVTGTATICGGNSTNLSIAGSQSGVNYQLRNNTGNAGVGSAVAGTGGTITLPTGSLSSTTTFNVLATNVTTSCNRQMANTITITVNAAPGDNSGGDKSICTGSSVSLGASSTTGHTYRWSPSTGLSSTTASNPTATPTVTTTYTLTETITSTGCSVSNPTAVTVNAYPDVTISPSYCNGGGNVVLSVPTAASYIWSNGGTNQSITVDRAGTFAVTVTNASGCTATNSYTVALELVSNGDFESGNTGFTTTYTYTSSSGGLVPEGYYAVGANANYYHSNFYGVDHTSGSGKFLIVNGATSATPVVVWQETVTLIPNTNYYFSAYAMSMNQVSPYAQLKFAVNGVQVGTTAMLTQGANSTSGPFAWTRFYATWNSGTSTTVTLSIVDLQTVAGGNDFGLDDISCSTLSTVPLSAAPSTNSPCIGSSLILSSNILGGMAPMTYKWSGPSSYGSTVMDNTLPNATTLMAGVYSLTVTDAHGCSVTGSTSSAVINPIPDDNAGSDVSVCNGAGIALGATGIAGHTYSWSPSTGLSGSTLANPTAAPAVNTTYTLTETISATGCSVTNTAAVTVGSLPSNSAGSAKSICNAGSVVIGSTSISGHTYSWSPSTGLSNVTASNPTAAPTVTTTYTLTETITATGCSAANSVVVTVNSIPGNNAGSAKSVCSGSGVAIGASSTAGHTYSWSPSTGLSSSTAANPTATPTVTTTYNLTETITATTCAATNSAIVTVNALPGNNAGSNQSACGGVGIVIGASTVAGHTYSWSPSTALTSATVANPTATPTVTTTYTLTETITATGCSAANSVVITPNAAPVSKTPAAASATICTGSSTNIQIPASQSGVNYQLRNNADNSSVGSAVAGNTATINLPTGTLSATTAYNVLATVSATGCTAQMASTVTVTVNVKSADPTSATAGSATICNGSSTTLTLTGGGGGTGETVKWYTASCGGTLAATGNGASVSPTTTTTYYGRYEDATPCSYNSACASVTVTVNAKSANPTSATASVTSVCSGNAVTLTLNGGGGGTGTVIKWYSGSCGGTLVGTGNGLIVYPTSNTTYYGRYEDPSPCSVNTTCASVAISVTAGPANKTVTAVASSVCSGSSTNIQVASAVLGVTYQLRNNADNSNVGSAGIGLGGTLNLSTGALTSTTTFNVLATTVLTGCTLQMTNTPTVTVNAGTAISSQPTNQVSCGGNDVTFSVTTGGSPTYKWYENRGTGFTAITDGVNSFGEYKNSTSNTLQIKGPTSAMNGWTYYCTITGGSCGTTNTNTVSLTISDAGTWNGSYSINWDDAANWCNGVPNQTTDVTIPSGVPHQPTVNANDAQCHNLTINSGATLTICSGGQLTMYGDLAVNGTYNHTAGTIYFKGSVNQNIAAISAYNVTIDNNAGVTLTGDMVVTNTLTFNNGLLNTGTNEVNVTNASTSSVVNFDKSKYVNGFLRRSVSLNGTYNFPVGSSTQCELAIINFTAQLGISNVVANFNVASMGNVPTGLSNGGKQISQFLNYGYWTITPNQQPIAGVYSITLNPLGHSNGGGASNYIVVKKPHGSASTNWSAPGTNLLNIVPTILGAVGASMSGLTSFSDFGAGVQTGTVLPIKLISFTAEKCDDDADALLKWSTATEENNDHFELQEATDNGENSGQLTFHPIGEVKGAGNSVEELNYSFVDMEPNKSGTRYYRLKQVDFDSTATFSNIVALDFNGAPPIQMSALYPNPVSEMLHFKLASPDQRTVTVSVSNLIGQEIFREPMQVNAGENSMNLDVTQLNKGLYFLSLIDGSAKYVPQKFEKF